MATTLDRALDRDQPVELQAVGSRRRPGRCAERGAGLPAQRVAAPLYFYVRCQGAAWPSIGNWRWCQVG